METLIETKRARRLVGKLLYGVLFVGVLPGLLVMWACCTSSLVHLPALCWQQGGMALAGAGLLAMAAGVLALGRMGGGLPMNAFPPPRFVSTGAYGLVPHPIYGGFVLLCLGASLLTGSASGLWLVTPSVALGCAALVLGYELPDLRRRFGKPTASVWLAADEERSASLLERLRVYFVVVLPWLAIFEGIGWMGVLPDEVSTYLDVERTWPTVGWAEIPYASTYLLVLAAPLLIMSARTLRRFGLLGLRAMGLIFPLYLLLPFHVPPRPGVESGILGWLMAWERTPISGIGAFPSFHVTWACIVASVLGSGGRVRRVLAWSWAALVAVSCVLTGMHSMADVVAGALAFVLVAHMDALWRRVLLLAERVANSWREWRVGRLRIINHGAWAGLGALVGVVWIDTLLGPGQTASTFALYLFSTVGAALWAQWVEGSPALLRPMGFYGGMIGAILGCGFAMLMGVHLWVVMAAVAVATPWIQGIGRLRCLVQGCCHGRAATEVPGIRYMHPRTRVFRLAHLAGVPVHATPVYSMLCNLAIGLALWRMNGLGASCAMLCGVYLLLSGAGRFVEEAYRGEPQTMNFCGLHLYQWIALATAAAGAVLTALPSEALMPVHSLRLSSFAIAVVCGAMAWFVTGMDFPESNRRFARLT